MGPLHNVSHAGQAGVAFPLSTLDAAKRAPDATPPVADQPAADRRGPQPLRPALASPKPVADAPLSAAELSTRTHSALRKAHITTIGQLCALKLNDLKWLRNFGKKAVAETITYRARLGVPMNSEA